MNTVKETVKKSVRTPTVFEAFSCFIFLLISIIYGIIINDMSIGIVMIINAVFTTAVGLRCGYTWSDIEKGINDKIGDVIDVLIVLCGIGFTIATWMFSGTIPVAIYYLLQLIHPDFIVPFAFVACSLTAIAIGTSWGTAGTIGIVMIGMGDVAGTNMALLAGAVVAGSHFGQAFSPMSDMCNLAASINRITTYNVLKGTAYVVFPTAFIAFIAYTILGLSYGNSESIDISNNVFTQQVGQLFNINPILLLPLVVLIFSSLKRLPVVPSMFGAGFLAIALGVGFNGFDLIDGLNAGWSGFSTEMIPGSASMEVSPQITALLQRGGISSMGWMFVVMFCAMTFIGAFSAIGCLNVIVETLFSQVKKKSSLIISSTAATLTCAIATTESYISVIVATELFKDKFKKFGISRNALSTTTLSASAIFMPLIPWGTAGIYMAGITGVPMLELAPFAFLCWGTPIMAMILGQLGIGPKDEVINEELQADNNKG